jgi:hypothetical protein
MKRVAPTTIASQADIEAMREQRVLQVGNVVNFRAVRVAVMKASRNNHRPLPPANAAKAVAS